MACIEVWSYQLRIEPTAPVGMDTESSSGWHLEEEVALSADPGALPPALCPSGAVSQPSPVWAVPQHSPILTEHLHSCSQLQVREGPHPPPGQSSWGAAGPLWGTQKHWMRHETQAGKGIPKGSREFSSQAGRSQAQL